jgi:4-hydroxy-tetrahydrodipicolinate synthase
LYNVPSRTGVDIPVSVYKRLSRIPNIAGVKEASTDITKITNIRHSCGTDLPIWTGNDDQITPVTALGGSGVISVLSNVLPQETCALANAAIDGDFDTASALQIELQPLIAALFSEVNPIPVKAAMKLIGYDCGGCRLPLTNAQDETVNKLRNLLK